MRDRKSCVVLTDIQVNNIKSALADIDNYVDEAIAKNKVVDLQKIRALSGIIWVQMQDKDSLADVNVFADYYTDDSLELSEDEV